MSRPMHSTSGELPGACHRVVRAYDGHLGDTDFSRQYGAFRYDDITELTGFRCDERKNRELCKFDRDLVCRQDVISHRTVRGQEKPSRFRVYWKNDAYPAPAVGRDIDTSSTPAIPLADFKPTFNWHLRDTPNGQPSLFDVGPVREVDGMLV